MWQWAACGKGTVKVTQEGRDKPYSRGQRGKASTNWHFPALAALREWCFLLTRALLKPGSTVRELSLWSLQTGYHSAPGPCFQPSVSQGETWSQRLWLEWEGKKSWLRPLGSAVTLLSWGPACSRSQDGRVDRAWKWCHCTNRQTGTRQGPQGGC